MQILISYICFRNEVMLYPSDLLYQLIMDDRKECYARATHFVREH